MLHPDKHGGCSTRILDYLGGCTKTVVGARDSALDYLKAMLEGKVRAAPQLRGVYYLEVPENFHFFLMQHTLQAALQEGSRGGSTHSFLQTSDNLYAQVGLGEQDARNPQVISLNYSQARDFYE